MANEMDKAGVGMAKVGAVVEYHTRSDDDNGIPEYDLDRALHTVIVLYADIQTRKALLATVAALLNADIVTYKTVFQVSDTYGLDASIISDKSIREFVGSLLA